jgi:hypothetical protein
MKTSAGTNMHPDNKSARVETVPVDMAMYSNHINPKMYIGVAKGSAFLLACGLVCALWALLIYSLFDSAFWGRELLNQLDNEIAYAVGVLLFLSIPFCLVAILFFFGLMLGFIVWIRTCIMVSKQKLIFGDGYVKIFVALSGVDYRQAKYLVFDMDGISKDDNHICFTKPMFNLNDLQFRAFFGRHQFINLTDNEITDYGRRFKKLYYEPFLNSYIYGRDEQIFYRNGLFE